MKSNNFSRLLNKWSRVLHKDLSFFFSGIILVYAVSGIILNHRDTLNADYSVTVNKFTVADIKPKADIDKPYVIGILADLGEVENYTKHYFPEQNKMKVFLKGGSSLVMDISTGDAIYESLKRRHVFSALNRLHYNPNKWWTIFSDIFAVSLILITITGIIMNKGKGRVRGYVEILAGIIIPLLFILI